MGRNRIFLTTPENRERAILSIRDDIQRLKTQSLSEEEITDYVLSLVKGMANQLFNTPLDMLIEHRLFNDFKAMRQSQFTSLWVFQAEGAQVFTNKETKRVSPNRIWKASVALNCALALFYDSLYEGKTEYARPYRASDIFATGQKLFGLWQSMIEYYQSGDEYPLVDEFARLLKLEGWFDWRADDGAAVPDANLFIPERKESSPEGTTNPELLKAKEPATVMYLLSTLERFEKMTDEQIRQVGFEVGITGMEGIDYADSEKQYTLKAFPGEIFSGLQMLCFMYVAFKRIDPSLDTGVDLEDAYVLAMKMHRAGNDISPLV